MNSFINKGILAISLMFVTIISWAQDKKLDVDINLNKGNTWYQQPWVWVVGGAIFILLLVGMLKGKK